MESRTNLLRSTPAKALLVGAAFLIAGGGTALGHGTRDDDDDDDVTLGGAPMSQPDLRLLASALGSLDGTVTHGMRVAGTVGVRFRQPNSQLNVALSDDFAAIIQAGSPSRATLSLVDGLTGPVLSAITYDGDGFVGTVDTPYVQLVPQEADSLARVFEPRRQIFRPTSLAHLSDVRVIPVTTAERGLVHFRADLNGTYMRGLVGAVGLSAGDLTGALTYPAGTIDVYTTKTGELVRETVQATAALDGQQAGRTWTILDLPIGNAALTFTATFTPEAVGEPVQVVRPLVATPDPGAEEDMLALALLSAGGSAADSYSQAVGSYAGMNVRALRRIEPNISWVRGRPARAARYEVRLARVAPRRVVMSTRTRSLRTFTLNQRLNGPATVTCRTRAGQLCEVSVFAKILARVTVRSVPKLKNRFHVKP